MEAITGTNTQAQAMAKKAWKIITLLFNTVRKGITNTNLHLLKHGSKLAGKAIETLFITLSHHHHHHHVYHKDVVRGFKEYEFSCSNSPALFHLIPLTKKSRLRRRRNDAFVAAAVQRVFDMLNTDAPAEAGAGSTVATPMLLPGFGKSPAVPVRQLRVTDSPFPVGMNEEEAVQVSKAAEEFISNFYRNLKREKSSTAFESPCRNRH